MRANVGIDGQEYARFGTTFGNQIIVVDRNGYTTDEAAIITGNGYKTIEALEEGDLTPTMTVEPHVEDFLAQLKQRED